MKVTKDIDIKDLKEVFKRQVDFAVKERYANVNINLVTALRILYVLEETQIREERHQTLESACTFMEMEDGTQTNELEYYNNTTTGKENQLALEKMLGKLGHIMGNECYECPKAYENITKAFEENKEKNKDIEECGKIIERFQKVNAIIPKCFGTFSCDRNMDRCFKCELIKECATKSEGCTVAEDEREKEEQICLEPACYGFYKSEEKCDRCKSREYCKSATEEERICEEELDDFV